MKTPYLAAVSALALMISISGAPHAVRAEEATSDRAVTYPAPARQPGESEVSHDIKSSLTDANNSMARAVNDIEMWFVGRDSRPGAKITPVYIKRAATAEGLIGEPVLDPDGKKIATLKDIIVDKNGAASMVVVSDGGTLGLGAKVAAFSYDKVVMRQPDGKVIMSLSKDMIDRATDFSYDERDWAKAKVIPQGSASVKELLDGKVVDAEGKKVASIENIYFRNGEVTQVLVGFDKTLGLGGELAALNYDDLQLVKKGEAQKDIEIKLSETQSAQFREFKKSVEN
ncbi:MAG: PRC-barrel domain-containing protein [Alphaproteobacteria bacterium]